MLRRERVLLLVLLAAVVIVWVLAFDAAADTLTITVLDVWQGDSILIQAPSGRTVLIDGGGLVGEQTRGYDVGKDVVLPALLARGVRKLDVLIITHQHEDHVGGLRAVIDQVPIGLVLDPQLPPTNGTYQGVLAALRAKRIPVRQATEGQQLNLKGGVTLEILSPPSPRLATESAENDDSLVMRLSYEGFSMLLAGDVEEDGARRIARLGPGVRSTVLKVPHHGSGDIVSTGFISAVHPELAVISVGARNAFGHPAREVLEELRQAGAKVMRTDQEGALTIRVKPPRWWAQGQLGGRRAEQVAGTLKEE